MKTYVFINNDLDLYFTASGDLYELINDLDANFHPGTYTIYETDLMPDQIKPDDIKKLKMNNKLKYCTMHTKYEGAH